jgi:hypothetical protein
MSVQVKPTAAEFTRLAKCLLQGKSQINGAIQAARMSGASPRVLAVLERSASNVAQLSDPDFGAALGTDFDAMARGLIEEARPGSAFYQLAALARPTAIMRGPASIATALRPIGEIAEATFTPVTDGTLERLNMTALLAGGILVLSDESANSTHPADFLSLQQALVALVRETVDVVALAHLTNGLTPITGTTDPLTDIRAALNELPAGVPLLFVMGSKAAQRLATHGGETGLTFPTFGATGGRLLGQTAVVSNGLLEDDFVILCPSQILVNEGAIAIAQSREATLKLATAPGDDAEVTSLFQQNRTAVKVLASFAAERASDQAVAHVAGVSWG